MQTDLRYSLYALLDDPDQVVVRSITAEILRQGPEMLSYLEEMVLHEADPSEKEEVARRLEEIYYEMVIHSMNEAASPEEGEQFQLLDFAVLLTKLLYRGEDWRELLNSFVAKSADMVKELSSGMTAMESCGVFNHIFFHRFGFKALPSDDLSPEYQMPATILNRAEGGKHVLMLLYFMFVQDCSLRHAAKNSGLFERALILLCQLLPNRQIYLESHRIPPVILLLDYTVFFIIALVFFRCF